jgi:hypothetical protein
VRGPCPPTLWSASSSGCPTPLPTLSPSVFRDKKWISVRQSTNRPTHWQGFGSRSVLDPDSIRSGDPDPYSESRSGSRRAKMTHKSRTKNHRKCSGIKSGFLYDNQPISQLNSRVSDPDSIRSVDPEPYSESGSGSRRAKMTHKSRTKIHHKCSDFCTTINQSTNQPTQWQAGRVSDPDPDWIRTQSGQWIRIRIQNPDPDADPGGQK